MERVLFVLALLALGYLLRRLAAWLPRSPPVPDDAAAALTAFVLWVSLPALILLELPKLEGGGAVLVPVAMPWVMLLVSAGLVRALAGPLGWSRSTTGLMMLLVPLGNTSFVGIPLVEAYFGAAGVPYALLYDTLGTFLALATYGSVVVAVYGGAERATLRGVLARVASFPPFLALVAAVALRGVAYPAAVAAALEVLASTLVPLVIVAVGLKMELTLPRENRAPLAVGLGLKLVAAPLVALALVRLLGVDGLPARVAVFEAGMPPQISAWALAMAAGLEPRLGASMVGVGIVAAMGTLFLLHLVV